MNDVFTATTKKGAKRPTVTVAQAQASLDRAHKELGKSIYGFELQPGDPRCTIRSTSRAGSEVTVTYGMGGRMLDATQLAYELNN